MQNSPARSGIDVGSVIAETYTIDALIGRGGMGAVFLASHLRLPGKKVAIKVLHAELSSEEVLARFRREAEIASRLGHPNIVTVHDFNVMEDGTPYLVLEYLEGESLAQRIKAGPLALESAMTIVRQVGSALAAAHREGIVHRDLKPQNIFLVPTEATGRVVEVAKVLDFGISKIRGSQTVQTQDSALLGTPQYMAPEQATGQHASVDERTDIFALGAIIYEMLSGQPAFTGASIPEVVFKVVYEQPVPLPQLAPSVPAEIAATVARAMAKQPAERFPGVGELVEALTGTPLPTTMKGPTTAPGLDGGPATGSRVKQTGQDAFAQTMGSGDHAGSVVPSAPPAPTGSAALAASVAETMAPGPVGATAQPPPSGPRVRPATDPAAAVPVDAPTVASQSGEPVPASAGTGAIPPARRRSLVPIVVACAIGGAALAGGGMYLAMRGPGSRASVAPQQVAKPGAAEGPGATAADQAAPPDDVVAPAAPDAAPAVVAEAPAATDAAPETPPPDHAQPNRDKPDRVAKKPAAPAKHATDEAAAFSPEAGDDPVVAAKLVQAEGALGAEKWDKASSLANGVLFAGSAGPLQLMRAHAIHGVAECVAHNSRETAKADLRAIVEITRRYPKLRKHLVRLRRQVVTGCPELSGG